MLVLYIYIYIFIPSTYNVELKSIYIHTISSQQVACYPSFGGTADWVLVEPTVYFWRWKPATAVRSPYSTYMHAPFPWGLSPCVPCRFASSQSPSHPSPYARPHMHLLYTDLSYKRFKTTKQENNPTLPSTPATTADTPPAAPAAAAPAVAAPAGAGAGAGADPLPPPQQRRLRRGQEQPIPPPVLPTTLVVPQTTTSSHNKAPRHAEPPGEEEGGEAPVGRGGALPPESVEEGKEGEKAPPLERMFTRLSPDNCGMLTKGRKDQRWVWWWCVLFDVEVGRSRWGGRLIPASCICCACFDLQFLSI